MSSDNQSVEHMEKRLSDTSIRGDGPMDVQKSNGGANSDAPRLTTAQILEQKVQEVVDEEEQLPSSWAEQVSDEEISSTLENLKFLEGLSPGETSPRDDERVISPDIGDNKGKGPADKGSAVSPTTSPRLFSPTCMGGKTHPFFKNQRSSPGKKPDDRHADPNGGDWPDTGHSWDLSPDNKRPSKPRSPPDLNLKHESEGPTPSLLRKIIQTTSGLFENRGIFDKTPRRDLSVNTTDAGWEKVPVNQARSTRPKDGRGHAPTADLDTRTNGGPLPAPRDTTLLNKGEGRHVPGLKGEVPKRATPQHNGVIDTHKTDPGIGVSGTNRDREKEEPPHPDRQGEEGPNKNGGRRTAKPQNVNIDTAAGHTTTNGGRGDPNEGDLNKPQGGPASNTRSRSTPPLPPHDHKDKTGSPDLGGPPGVHTEKRATEKPNAISDTPRPHGNLQTGKGGTQRTDTLPKPHTPTREPLIYYSEVVARPTPSPAYCRFTMISTSNRFSALSELGDTGEKQGGQGREGEIEGEPIRRGDPSPTHHSPTSSHPSPHPSPPPPTTPPPHTAHTKPIDFDKTIKATHYKNKEIKLNHTTDPTNMVNLMIKIDTSNKRSVTLQEDTATPRGLLPPTAAALWRQSRNLLATATKTSVRADWLTNLNEGGIITPWAAGLAPLPSYCVDDPSLKADIIEIRQQAAIKIQERTSYHLHARSDRDRAHSAEVLATAERVSGEDPQVILSAVQTSANMVGRGKAELIRDLRERKAHLSQRQLTELDWLHFEKLGAPKIKTPSTPPQQTHSRASWKHGGTHDQEPEYDSPLTRVENQGNPHVSFGHHLGRNPKLNIFDEIEGAVGATQGEGNTSKKTLKFQFRNPDSSNQPTHFQNSQASGDETRQDWGGRGPTYRRNESNYQNTQTRGGGRGKRPREESRDRTHTHNQHSRGGRGRGRGRSRDSSQGGRDPPITEREWAILKALRQ